MQDTEVDEESEDYLSDQKDFEQLPESTSDLKDDVLATNEDMQEAGRELDGIHHPEKKPKDLTGGKERSMDVDSED
jgi:hypothetical protein